MIGARAPATRPLGVQSPGRTGEDVAIQARIARSKAEMSDRIAAAAPAAAAGATPGSLPRPQSSASSLARSFSYLASVGLSKAASPAGLGRKASSITQRRSPAGLSPSESERLSSPAQVPGQTQTQAQVQARTPELGKQASGGRLASPKPMPANRSQCLHSAADCGDACKGKGKGCAAIPRPLWARQDAEKLKLPPLNSDDEDDETKDEASTDDRAAKRRRLVEKLNRIKESLRTRGGQSNEASDKHHQTMSAVNADLAPEVAKEAERGAATGKSGLHASGRSRCLEWIDPLRDALVIGDTDLTFSLALAEHRQSQNHMGRTVATTFERLEILRERYAEIDMTIKKLEEIDCEVLHSVDCTLLPADHRFNEMEAKFDTVYYNFPHLTFRQGSSSGQSFVRWRLANRMYLFFRALRTFVKPGGCVKVTANSGALTLQVSDIVAGAVASEFRHDETFRFSEWLLSRLRRSYADSHAEDKHDGKKNGDKKDMVYCFTYQPSGEVLSVMKNPHPPTHEEIAALRAICCFERFSGHRR